MRLTKEHRDFINWLSPKDETLLAQHQDHSHYKHKYLCLKDLTLKDLKVDGKHVEDIELRDCRFEDCDFSYSFFSEGKMENCYFKNCEFSWTKFFQIELLNCRFEACTVIDLTLSDGIIRDTLFINCDEIFKLSLRGFKKRKVAFQNCYLYDLTIEHIHKQNQFKFIDCLINDSDFKEINFFKSVFKNCTLSSNRFSACKLANNTFKGKNKAPGSEYNLVDFRTIIESPTLDATLLENLFGIQNSEVKEYLVGLTHKIEFQSIFISYSFKDKAFAGRINEELMRRGILTFLWEKDAPAGKPLKSIMTSGIKNKDRILFIASKDSLKSAACHYELSEGRKKQEAIWEEVLFPIHIDNFLFEVTQDAIRPKEKQQEYWANIEELKQLHSLSFCNLVDSKSKDHTQFEQQLLKLIKGLRKN